ncbi:zf-HC2 domain-containing protein [Granulicella sp. dw_53]|uniref:anti-sigma factor family protein n=1 Tax=Granulicella sp. dw_53 TaxID=2719792 RepID=UPI001BD6C1CD|nr:zf-HC2 domain-containing protein [Granulicella sp. dw_53]
MRDQNDHLSDEQVLLLLDGEMSAADEAVANAHLEQCPDCYARRVKMEGVLAEVIAAHQASVGEHVLPSATGPQALLKLRLRAAGEGRESWTRRLGGAVAMRPQLYLYAALVVAVIGIGAFYRQKAGANRPRIEFAYEAGGRVPNRSLTPGATRPVQLADICSVQDDDRDPAVSSSMLRTIFQEYGMAPDTSAKDYQVDYLINPQLGGTDDIRNLWPEPYTSTVWNARVKDALEDRLHQMVCDGQIDLASAQRDIATDWIAAYQKYFHTPKPV